MLLFAETDVQFHFITPKRSEMQFDLSALVLETFQWLSLKRGFGRCGHGFDGCDGLGGLDGSGGFSGFDGYPTLSLKGFSVSFTLLLKVL